MSIFISDTQAHFGRRKGSKDKKKRSVTSRVIGGGIGALGGAAITGAGLAITKAALTKSGKNPQLLNTLTKHTRSAVIGGSVLGAGVGATTDGEQLKEGRRVVSTANRSSQELRGYLSMGKRYGIL